MGEEPEVLLGVTEAASPEPEPEPPKVDEPPEDSPRWKEVYHNWKESDRKVETLEKQLALNSEDVKGLVEHNKKLAEALEKNFKSLESKMDMGTRPDPTEDPEAYEAYVLKKVQATLQPVEMPTFAPPQAPPVQPVAPQGISAIEYQAEIMKTVYPDYSTAAEEVNVEMKTNTFLANQIMSSENPPKAAYEYWKQKKGEAIQRNEQGTLEGSTFGVQQKAEKLTEAEKRWAKNLGLSEKDVESQIKYTRGG